MTPGDPARGREKVAAYCELCERPLADLFGREPAVGTVLGGRVCLDCHAHETGEPAPVPDVKGQGFLPLE